MNSDSTDRSPAWLGLFFDNRHLLALVSIVTLVAGLSAINGLPRLEDPVITNRGPVIVIAFPGASADRVEALVTEKVEDELDEIEAIKHVNSTSRAGVAVINLELQDAVTKKTVEPIHSEIRDALADATRSFPPEVLPPLYDDKRNPVAYTLVTALRWSDAERGEQALGILSRQAEELADRLRGVAGTEIVRLYGLPDEEIRVTLDPDRLAELRLSPAAVATALRNSDAKVPSGQLRGENADLLVEVQGRFDGIDRVREVIVAQEDETGRTVRVGDVAEVERTWTEPPSQIALTNGQRAVFVAARIAEDRRVDRWDDAADRVVSAFRAEAGDSIAVDTVFRQNDYTTDRLGELATNLLLGGLVVLVVIFFTMGWRRSLIVSSALPLTAAATLFVVSLQGGKLHQMSIFGMIIALGLLIDTAIVITDEVRKFLDQGMRRREAVVAALRHLFVPLLSSTLTSVLAFLPILLLPGSAGDFVGSIGGSVIIAISASFVLSITVIAALAGLLSESPGSDEKKRRSPRWMREGVEARWFARPMLGLIHVSARKPVIGILVASAIPVAGFLLAGTLGSQFFPRTDRDMFTVEMTFPSSTAIDRTIAEAGVAEELIRAKPGVERVHWLAGASFPPVYYNLIENRDNSAAYVMAVIDADTFETVDRIVPELQAELDRALPGALVRVSKFAQGPPANADVEIRLLGPSLSTLQELGDEVQRRLGEHPDIVHAESTLTRGEPKLWIRTDEAAARAAGIEPTSIAQQLQTGLEGLDGGSVLEAVEEMPVRVRFPAKTRNAVASIEDLRLVGSSGDRVPLRAIGDLELRPETGTITRRNGERMNSVRGYAEIGSLPIDITNEVVDSLEADGFSLPPGYRLELGGEAENQGDAVGNLLLYLPVIVTLTIAILVLSFRSVRLALILLATAGLSVGYGLFATWAMQFPISFNTILGCIGLVGLAFNDNIVAIAAIISDEKAKGGDPEAIAERIAGCGRHLISTTLTTIGSFLPLLILIGGQFWPPLAIVLAGGVGGATLLAATFVPAVYRIALWKPRWRKQEASTSATGPLAEPA